MATHIDNSQNMSSTDIKNILINTFKKSAEKSVKNADYDKTILATIQYCTDATIGQYKIKYQNGYFTAYSNTDTVYANKATVYVLVPGNDMNNRMFITGLANNDNNSKIALSSLEPDQEYSASGPNFISSYNDINMQSYWVEHEDKTNPNSAITYTRTLYDYSKEENAIQLIDANEINAAIKNGGGYLKLAAKFKTAFKDDQKVAAADYGIILKLSFTNVKDNNGCKNYVLNTFNMVGSPFNFSTYMPQAQYWEIDVDNFIRVESIEEYMIGFNPYDPEHPQIPTSERTTFRDIYISNLEVRSASKLYNITNDLYAVHLNMPTFTFSEQTNSIPMTATLTKSGTPVVDPSQNLKYFWGKEDSSIDSVNNPRYNSYLGKGWYCLNTALRKDYDEQTISDLTNYTIANDEVINKTYVMDWITDSRTVELKKDLCSGKISKIKCVVVYQNVVYESNIQQITNPTGKYLIIHSDSSDLTFKNGQGYMTLTAGLFSDDTRLSSQVPEGESLEPIPHTMNSNITYTWTEVNSVGVMKTLPDYRPSDILFYFESWNQEHDNVTLTDEEVEAYLETEPFARYCLNRYNYYNNEYTQLNNKEEPTEEETTWKQRAYDRSTTILSSRINQIKSYYVENGSNQEGYYILGPSKVTGKYNNNINNYTSVTVDTTTPYYYGTANYNTYKDHLNTLYLLKGTNIQTYATYKVSAIEHTVEQGVNISRSVGTATIMIQNKVGSDLTYDLMLINGDGAYTYDESGLAPNSSKKANPIFLRPIYFQLLNRDGTVIYDSQLPDEDNEMTTLAELKPVWSLYNNGHSLLRTDYPGQTDICSIDPDDNRRIKVRNQASFIYDLEETFDHTKKDYGQIELQVNYGGQTIVATTNFTYSKEGELGTNGTNGYLKIVNAAYDSYKDGVLASELWSNFADETNGSKTVEHADPVQRFLNNAYLYATHCYSDQAQELYNVQEAKYVNLLFAQGPQKGENGRDLDYDGGTGVHGEKSATFVGYWYEDFYPTPIDRESKWSTELDHGKYQGVTYYCTPSFRLNDSVDGDTTGSQVVAYINPVQDHPEMAYKPTTIDDYVPTGFQTSFQRTANNIIGLKASYQATDQQDPVTDSSINRNCYGYYSIPYFYFARYYTDPQSNVRSNVTPQYLDPARHIVVTGGFNEVYYDSAGCNPTYNKQQPFKVHLFNEKNEDITADLLESVAAGNSIISWSHSKGFKKILNFGHFSVSNYEDINPNEPLYGQYCYSGDKYYRCIKDHTKSQKVTLNNGTEVDPMNGLVKPYWVEVDIDSEGLQKIYLKPNSKYDSLAAATLFNSWVSVYVRYVKSVNEVYEAEAFIPINVICNRYGSAIINNWDGKKTKVEDGYIISNAVAAGVQDDSGKFIGATIGTNIYPENDDRETEVGLMGFGYPNYYKNNIKGADKTWARTFFMDATTGRVVLGPSGSTQIVLNPYIPPAGDSKQESWSRLAGWYFSQNFLYKPVGEGDVHPASEAWQPYDITPNRTPEGSAGIYAPYYGTVSANDVFLWASAKQKDLDLDNIIEQLETDKAQLEAYGATFSSEGKLQNQRIIDDQFAEQASKYRHYQTFCNEVNLGRITIDLSYEEQTIAVKNMVTEEEYNTLVAQIEEEQTHYSPPKTVEEAAAIVAQDYFRLMTRIADQQLVFDELCMTYDNLYNLYGSIVNSESNGVIVTWETFNNKKANFYVTYGGFLHASSADIEGNIAATTGSFGKGPNRIKISTVENGVGYLLYSENFRVQDSTDPEIYIKGDIRAKSGQFGKVGNDIDGFDTRTMFVQYAWYPWNLPEDNEEWSKLYLDTSAGKTTKYLLYHPNFYIKGTGSRAEAFFNGNIYSIKGRIGDWIITTRDLKDITDSIRLHPANRNTVEDYNEAYIRVGDIKIKGEGSIGKTTEGATETDWWIDKNGIAKFNNPSNQFRGSSFKVNSGGSWYGLDGDGLELKPGQVFKIGNTVLQTYENGDGFRITGKVQFDNETNFSDNLNIRSGKGVYLEGSNSTTWLKADGLIFSGANTAQYTARGISFGGSASIISPNIIADFDLRNCTFNGNTLEQVIVDILRRNRVVVDVRPDYANVPRYEGNVVRTFVVDHIND